MPGGLDQGGSAFRGALEGYSRWSKARLCAELEGSPAGSAISETPLRGRAPYQQLLERALLKLQADDVAAIEAAIKRGVSLAEEYREVTAEQEERLRQEKEEYAEHLRAREEARRRSFWFRPDHGLGVVEVNVPALRGLPLLARLDHPMWGRLYRLQISESPKTGVALSAGQESVFIAPKDQARVRRILRDLGLREGRPR